MTDDTPRLAQGQSLVVERVVFRDFPGPHADIPSAFAITADGKEWRLSEDEIKNAINMQPIAALAPGNGAVEADALERAEKAETYLSEAMDLLRGHLGDNLISKIERVIDLADLWRKRAEELLAAQTAPSPAALDPVTVEAEKTYDEGITFAIEQLALILGVEDRWSIQDGSDDHDQDVRDTIRHVLDQSHYAPPSIDETPNDLLSRARQFVADSGCDEDDHEVNIARNELLSEIDRALIGQPASNGEPVEALKHALARFECLAEQFEETGDTASWAMCSVDADRMRRALIGQPSCASKPDSSTDREQS